MQAFGGMVARLEKPETLQGIYRSHLDKIYQHPKCTYRKICCPSKQTGLGGITQKNLLQTIAVENTDKLSQNKGSCMFL